MMALELFFPLFLIARRGWSDWELQATLFTDRWHSDFKSPPNLAKA